MGVQNMGQTPSLESYIQSGSYQTVAIDSSAVTEDHASLAEALNPIASNEPARRLTPEATGELTGEGQSPAAIPGTGESTPTVTLTAEQQAEDARIRAAQADLERREREFNEGQERLRQQQAQAALADEQRRFLAHYNSLDDPAERQVAMANYQRVLAERQARAATEQVQQIQRRSYADREQIAKNQVIFATMRQHQIPQEFKAFLDKATDERDLDNMVSQIKSYMAKNGQTQAEAARQARSASGIDAAGGANAGFVPPAEPKKRSGDLMGLINSRQHQLINAMIEPV